MYGIYGDDGDGEEITYAVDGYGGIANSAGSVGDSQSSLPPMPVQRKAVDGARSMTLFLQRLLLQSSHAAARSTTTGANAANVHDIDVLVSSQRSAAPSSTIEHKVAMAPLAAAQGAPTASGPLAQPGGHNAAGAAQRSAQQLQLTELSQLFNAGPDAPHVSRHTEGVNAGRSKPAGAAHRPAGQPMPGPSAPGAAAGPRGMAPPQMRPSTGPGARLVGPTVTVGKRPLTSMAPAPRGPLVHPLRQGMQQVQTHRQVARTGLMQPPAAPLVSQSAPAHGPVRAGPAPRPGQGDRQPPRPEDEGDRLLADLLEAQANRHASRGVSSRFNTSMARPASASRGNASTSFATTTAQAHSRPMHAGTGMAHHRPQSAGAHKRATVPLPANIFVPIDAHLQAPTSSQAQTGQLDVTYTGVDPFGLLLHSNTAQQARTKSGFAAVTTAAGGSKMESVQGAFGGGGQSRSGYSAAVVSAIQPQPDQAQQQQQQQEEMDVDDRPDDMHDYAAEAKADNVVDAHGQMDCDVQAGQDEAEDEEGWGDLTEEMRDKLRASKAGKHATDASTVTMPVPLLEPTRSEAGAGVDMGHGRRLRQRSPLGRADATAEGSSRERAKDKGPLLYDMLLSVLDQEGKLCESNRRKLEQAGVGPGVRPAGRASLGTSISTQAGDAAVPRGPAPFLRQASSVTHMGSQGGCLEVRADREVRVTGTCGEGKLAVLCTVTYSSLSMQGTGQVQGSMAGSLESVPIGSQLILLLQHYRKDTFVPDLRLALLDDLAHRQARGQGMEDDSGGTAADRSHSSVRIRLFKPLNHMWLTVSHAAESREDEAHEAGKDGSVHGDGGMTAHQPQQERTHSPQKAKPATFALYQGAISALQALGSSTGQGQEPAPTLALGASIRLDTAGAPSTHTKAERIILPLILCPTLWCFWSHPS